MFRTKDFDMTANQKRHKKQEAPEVPLSVATGIFTDAGQNTKVNY